jgi:hypothetical protein
MRVLIHDDLMNYYVNHRIHMTFQKTLKQHEKEIRELLNFVVHKGIEVPDQSGTQILTTALKPFTR